MIKITKILACIFACICLSRTAWGWGSEGHMVIAQIAYGHLDPVVKAKCDALIALPPPCGTASFTFVGDSTWADQRCQSATSPEHYIDLPLCIAGYSNCCSLCADGSNTNNAPPGTPNVVTALNQYIATLLDTNAAPTNQATALRYVIHFAGDIEQPLHSSNGVSTNHPSGDSGGNSFKISGHWSELHALWDAGGGYLTDSVALVSNKVADVTNSYPYVRNVGTIPDPMTWAQDSWSIARTNVYYYPENGVYTYLTEGSTPSTGYLSNAMAVSKQQMAVGGQRLGNLLNTIFSTNVASFTASPTNGLAPLSVTFTDTSTGSITNWFWNFGDGTTTNFSTSTTPSRTYTAGTYNVTLIVSGYPGSSSNTASITATAAQGATLQVTSITAQGSDIHLTWLATGGTTNAVEATPGTPDYNTNFVNISGSIVIVGSGITSTNYVDYGAVTNWPNQFYRVRLVP